MALDNQTFIDLERDADDTGKFVNTKQVITPRYGNPFKSAPLVSEEAELKADEVVAKGFYLGFANEAAMRAYTPSFAETRAKLDDTKKVYRWERTSAEGVTPITGIWHDTGLSELDQAKMHIDNKVEVTDGSEIFIVKDSQLRIISFIDKLGHLYLPHLDSSVQMNLLNLIAGLNAQKEISTHDDDGDLIAKVVDRDRNLISFIDKLGHLYLPHLDSSVQTKIQQLKNQVIALTQIIANSNNTEQPDQLDETIGGIALEADGEIGSIYEGFKLSAGDDFNQLDILAPHRPLGRWFTTRTYLAGARGSDGALNRQYNTDPYHTGYNDSNRGVPVGFNNMFVENSVLTLNARTATPEQKAHFQGNDRSELASMISSIGAFSMYAGDEGVGENILEWRVRYVAEDGLGYTAGWHPTLWTQSSLPSITYNSNEWDVMEGNQYRSFLNYNEWGPDGKLIGGSTLASTTTLHDGNWHTVSAKFSHEKIEVYVDGSLYHSANVDANSFNEPAYSLITNHVYNGVFAGNTYDAADWASKPAGVSMQIDWTRLWRRSDKFHIQPKQRIIPIDIEYGAEGIIALPSKINLWGRTDVLEHIQCVAAEENEPGGSHTIAYDSLPDFIDYDQQKRVISINTEGQKSGRIHFVVYAYLKDGSTCEPARTYANIGPRIIIDQINLNDTGHFDLYAACDCGVLVTDGVSRSKKMSVSGLPAGVFYDDATGYLTSSDAQQSTTKINVTCENSIGQLTTKKINLTIGD